MHPKLVTYILLVSLAVNITLPFLFFSPPLVVSSSAHQESKSQQQWLNDTARLHSCQGSLANCQHLHSRCMDVISSKEAIDSLTSRRLYSQTNTSSSDTADSLHERSVNGNTQTHPLNDSDSTNSTNMLSNTAQGSQTVGLLSLRPPRSLPYLIIGVPTVSRPQADYLNPTLDRIAEQLTTDKNDPFYNQILVYVMNNNIPASAHVPFERAKARYGSHPSFRFLQNEGHYTTEVPVPKGFRGQTSLVTENVRKQTRDVVALLKYASERSHYYLFTEDDFGLCVGALHLIQHVIRKAHSNNPDWISIKISYGLNGFILRNDNGDLSAFADYLYSHQSRRPPDHLQTEWAAGETRESAAYKAHRPHVAYRYNLLFHMGTVSSLRTAKQEFYPECFHELNAPILFEVDAFKPRICGHDDMWPCPTPTSSEYLSHPPLPINPNLFHCPAPNHLPTASPSELDAVFHKPDHSQPFACERIDWRMKA
eukprot:TRINITY_DN909_c0_g1_i1.p1 TRINITY_DN909_c0_g1~~TRINITY_DN909_c0_g1_i1.p1  ORF type:complete len:481 (+),score=37.04 TRINITY_DN909_c0_g1_i1:66-1508(+)